MNIKTYESASDYLGTKESRPLPGRSTRLMRMSDICIVVRYHSTNVVSYYKSGEIVLDTGGWWTVTTKARLNEYAPVRVSQRDGEWFVRIGSRDSFYPLPPETYQYVDGMRMSERLPYSNARIHRVGNWFIQGTPDNDIRLAEGVRA